MTYKNMEAQIQMLINCLEDKLDLLNELIKFTKQQRKLIEEENIDKLERILESKQVRMDRINKIDNEFIKNYESIKENYDIADIGELTVDRLYLKELKEKTKDVSDRLEEIYKLDKINDELINKSYNKLKGRVKTIKQGKNVRSGYERQISRSGGIYIDKKN